MSCDEYQVKVSVMMDNELSDSEGEELLSHLGNCRACRQEFRSQLALRSGLKEDVPLLAPRELDEKVLGRLHEAGRPSAAGRRLGAAIWRRTVSMPLPLAAVLAGLLLVAGLGLTSVWSPFATPQVRVVYVTMLPTVEVQGYMP
jgi:anti-sigma factor RsiW